MVSWNVLELVHQFENLIQENNIFHRKILEFSKITIIILNIFWYTEHVKQWSLLQVQQICKNPYYLPLLFEMRGPSGPLLGLGNV